MSWYVFIPSIILFLVFYRDATMVIDVWMVANTSERVNPVTVMDIQKNVIVLLANARFLWKLTFFQIFFCLLGAHCCWSCGNIWSQTLWSSHSFNSVVFQFCQFLHFTQYTSGYISYPLKVQIELNLEEKIQNFCVTRLDYKSFYFILWWVIEFSQTVLCHKNCSMKIFCN